ncbi:MAG: BatA domain-containing protein [Calditrichia bacterium]
MFSFLNPAILVALAAGAVPLIIHLLNRHKHKEVYFSTIEFLKQMAQREMRRMRLRQILLLLIRTLMILLLVLAFARPTLTQSSGLLPGRDAAEVVVVVDNSLSMSRMSSGGTALDMLKEQLLKLGGVLKSGDIVSVITLGKPPEMRIKRKPFSEAAWTGWVSEIPETALTDDMPAALQLAARLFSSTDLAAKELYIISDFQKKAKAVEEATRSISEKLGEVKRFLIPIEQTEALNLSVDSVIIRNQLVEVGTPVHFSAIVSNHYNQLREGHLFNLFLNEKNLAQQSGRIAQKRTEQIDFQLTQRFGGYLLGRVESEPDELSGDNHHYLNYFVPEKIRVLLFQENSGSSILKRVLQPAVKKGVFQVTLADAAKWAEEDFFKYEVILFENLSRPSEGLISRLQRFNEAGGAVIAFPDVNSDLKSLNKMLSAFKAGKMGMLVGSPGDHTQAVSLSAIPQHHAIFDGLLGEQGKISPIKFYAYFKLHPAGGAEKLLRFSNGEPFLIQTGQQGAFFFGSAPLNTGWTELPLKGFVVPLIYRLIYAGAVKLQPERLQLKVGEDFEYLFRGGKSLRELTLEKPDGGRLLLYPEKMASGYRIAVPHNRLAGHYKIFNGEQLLLVYSVNHSREESQWDFYNQSELESLIPGANYLKPEPNEDLAAIVEAVRMGRELWGYLLSAVILLIALEMVLAYRRASGEREQNKMQTVFSAE